MEWQERKTNEQAFFAASNSRSGFRSYYEHCFRARVDRLYCIKGGPGTGKSTLMRQIARRGEELGYRVEYWYCSSDATSLDGVLLFGKTDSFGLVDATAPHVFEPWTPGVAEDIMDLGQYWDSALLSRHKEEIRALQHTKRTEYAQAYRYLGAYGEVSDAIRDVTRRCLNTGKLERLTARLLRDIPMVKGEEVEIRLRRSVGMCGAVGLSTYAQQSGRLCLIEDHWDGAYELMALLDKAAAQRGLKRRVSYHPILPDRIDALCLGGWDTTFLVCSPQELREAMAAGRQVRVVKIHRMLNADDERQARGEQRAALRIREALHSQAQQAFLAVAKAHFSLERIYTSAMDFNAKEQGTQMLCKKLLGDEV